MLVPRNINQSPITVLGAGDLVSHLRRIDATTECGEAIYLFNVFRETANGKVTHSLSVNNLQDLLDLCYVLAFAILDDGWLPNEQRVELQELLDKLDFIRQQETDHDG